MTARMDRTVLILAASVLSGCMVMAQESPNPTLSAGPTVVVTGCLQHGDQVNEYLLTALDDSKWQIKVPTSMDLVTQVGHLVQVRGVLANNSEETAESITPPVTEMTATDFKKVDENCGR